MSFVAFEMQEITAISWSGANGWTVFPAVVSPELPPIESARVIESEPDRIWRLLVLAAES